MSFQESKQPVKKKTLTKILDATLPFAIGGVCGMIATCFVQPVDMVKVRIQIKSEQLAKTNHSQSQKVSPISVAKEIYSSGGLRAFYKGLDSALTRQIFYATSRLGIYNKLFMHIKEEKNKGKDLSFMQKCFCSLMAGFWGSLIANPADLALIRMQNDTILKPEERRNYKNVGDAFSRIVKEEGVAALWRGCTPTVIRAMMTNLGMLAPYDEVKERLDRWTGTPDTRQNRLIASAVAGFMSSFIALPFDNAKTKIQKMKPGPDGKFPYANVFDALGKTVRREGVVGLWVGFVTFYFRMAPHVMIVLIIMDYFRVKIKKMRDRYDI